MTRRFRMGLAGAGSGLMLAGAFAFQHLGGLAPCAMCLWQRWPHAAALLFGILALWLPHRWLAALGALAALATAGLGLFHTGVERGWWEGPSTCTSGPVAGVDPAQLLAQILEAPVVRCDEVAWQMLGLSMASWNALASLVLALIWATALRRR